MALSPLGSYRVVECKSAVSTAGQGPSASSENRCRVTLSSGYLRYTQRSPFTSQVVSRTLMLPPRPIDDTCVDAGGPKRDSSAPRSLAGSMTSPPGCPRASKVHETSCSLSSSKLNDVDCTGN